MSLSKNSFNSQRNLNSANCSADEVYEFEGFRLDRSHLILYRDGNVVSLKPKVVETLVALVERAGEVISKDELMSRLWADSFVEESNLTQNIYLLRKILGTCTNGRPFIENFSRRGYRFNGEVRPSGKTEILLATHTRTSTVVEETVERNKPKRAWRNPLLMASALLVVGGTLGVTFGNFLPHTLLRKMGLASAAPFQDFRIRRYSDSNDVIAAVVSGDGKFIVYNDRRNALWLKNVATESNIRLLPDSEAATHSVISISPDNNYIYFLNAVKDKKSEMMKIPLLGGTAERINIDDAWSQTVLSPDGKQFAFTRYNNNTGEHGLVIARADGSGERTAAISGGATWFGYWSQSTAWSPDGGRIACAGGINADGRVAWNIRIFRVVDGTETLTINPAIAWSSIDSIAWLPDGDHLLAIATDASSDRQIYKYTISAGQWERLTNDLNSYHTLSVTADGKSIVTTQLDENTANLWIMPAQGDKQQARQITSGRHFLSDSTGISWTPDGKIVYATNAGGKWEIWRIDADGSNQTQLTHNCGGNDDCSLPVVSPDGHYIVFQARSDGVKKIWRMDADGSDPRQLTEGEGSMPAFSIDGTAIIYSRYTSPSTTLWQVPVAGGGAQQFSQISPAICATVSPDGKRMLFDYYNGQAKQPWQTCVAPVGAAAPEKCFGISRSFLRWAADGNSYYYLDHDYAGIWKQPLDGDRSLFLEFPGERTTNFNFSPDGKSLAVARSKPTQDIVAIIDER